MKLTQPQKHCLAWLYTYGPGELNGRVIIAGLQRSASTAPATVLHLMMDGLVAMENRKIVVTPYGRKQLGFEEVT